MSLPLSKQKRSEEIKLTFDQLSAYYATERERSYAYQAQVLRVLEAVPPGCMRVLDVGAGPALLADEFIGRGATYYAVDISLEMLKYGRGRHDVDNVYCVLADADRLSYIDSCIDVIVAMGVLEYLAQPARALNEFSRVLVPGGVAVITVPNGGSLHHTSRRAYWLVRTTAKKLLGLNTEPDTPIGIGGELPHRLGVRGWRKIVRESDFDIIREGFCNSRLVAYPFTKWVPYLDNWISMHTEWACRLPGACWTGGQLIMELRKPT